MVVSSTVWISEYQNLPALKMNWQTQIASSDVNQAFTRISEFLEDSPDALYVIVDLLQNPKFPLSATLNGAIFGPHRHPKLRAWLVVGTSSTARFIARTLSSVSRQTEIRWFQTEIEALHYIKTQEVLATASELDAY